MPPQPVYCSENNLFRVRAGYDDLKCPPPLWRRGAIFGFAKGPLREGTVCGADWRSLIRCSFPSRPFPVKKQLRNGRSRFGVANKNTISAIYAQSEAESIPNRLSRFNAPSQNPPARLRRFGRAPVSGPASRRIPDGTVPETAPAPAAVRCRSPSESRTSQW